VRGALDADGWDIHNERSRGALWLGRFARFFGLGQEPLPPVRPQPVTDTGWSLVPGVDPPRVWRAKDGRVEVQFLDANDQVTELRKQNDRLRCYLDEASRYRTSIRERVAQLSFRIQNAETPEHGDSYHDQGYELALDHVLHDVRELLGGELNLKGDPPGRGLEVSITAGGT
jgi:hypothetical protein